MNGPYTLIHYLAQTEVFVPIATGLPVPIADMTLAQRDAAASEMEQQRLDINHVLRVHLHGTLSYNGSLPSLAPYKGELPRTVEETNLYRALTRGMTPPPHAELIRTPPRPDRPSRVHLTLAGSRIYYGCKRVPASGQIIKGVRITCEHCVRENLRRSA